MPYYEGAAKSKPAARKIAVQVCRALGCRGIACFSDDLGKTWFCRADAPPGFFPHERGSGVVRALSTDDDVVI